MGETIIDIRAKRSYRSIAVNMDGAGVWMQILAAVFCAWVAGCSRSVSPPPAPTPQVTPTTITQPAVAPTSVTSITTSTSDVLTLTWWTPEFISPSAPQPGGLLLEEYLAEFETAHNGKLRVVPIPKARYGKGGLLDYLRTAQPVAPDLLPDIVALDLSELDPAVSAGLLRPLDGILAEEVVGKLYPFARSAGQFGDRLMAMPFVADLEHVAYDRERIQAPPSTWAEVLSNKVSYLFPAGSPQPVSAANPGESVQRSILNHYLAAGDSVDPQTRRTVLHEQPLMRVLSFYNEALSAGLLPSKIGEVDNLDDVWTAYAQGLVAMADVSARRYLVDRGSLQDSGFAPVPGSSGPAVPVPSGWALAIVTPDPERQKAAADLIAWLSAPERAGSWAKAAGWLPTSPEALAVWGTNPYYQFLNKQLASAVSQPIGPDSAQAAAHLQQAALAVLKGELSPADATQAALNPPK